MVYVERDVDSNIEFWLQEKEIIAIRGPLQSGKNNTFKKNKRETLS